MRFTTYFLAASSLTLGLTIPNQARAQTAIECAESFEQGQVDRTRLHLSDAKRAFAMCSQLACPQPIVKDCVEALEAVQRELPLFGFRVRDAEGHELLEVRVRLNGELLTDRLDGSMYQRDPGLYRVEFEATGFKPLALTLTLHPGERTRVVDVQVESTSAKAQPKQGVTLEPTPPPPPFRVPLESIITAGAGLAALGGFAYFRVRASQGYDSLESCRPYCSDERVEEVRTRYVLSSVALGVSGAALATAGVSLWLLQPRKERPTVALSVGLTHAVLSRSF
ncbi:MAG TPA: hypothetical protein VFQ61_34035 [Polyangiaceae bacterium]|nr:hypothetical protein [Polyangiaceae bacterium]